MSGERVLVVDDEPILTEVVQRYLWREAPGRRSLTASPASSGRAKARPTSSCWT